MADITMCFGNNCPKRENCFRFTAEPEPDDMQTYFGKEPGEMVGDKYTCGFFWKTPSKNPPPL